MALASKSWQFMSYWGSWGGCGLLHNQNGLTAHLSLALVFVSWAAQVAHRGTQGSPWPVQHGHIFVALAHQNEPHGWPDARFVSKYYHSIAFSSSSYQVWSWSLILCIAFHLALPNKNSQQNILISKIHIDDEDEDISKLWQKYMINNQL